MRKNTPLASALALAALAPAHSLAQGAPMAPSFDGLLSSALAHDAPLAALAVEEERASIALERARITRDSPSLKAGTGPAALSFTSAGYGLYATPEATMTLPGGASLGASSVLGLGVYGDYAEPGLSLGLPLLRGSDERLVAVEKARAAAFASRVARAKRRAAIEGELVSALKAAFAADIELQSARGAEAKARRELERSKTIDGSEPGGIAYRRLERELRSKARASSDASSKLADALDELSSIAGPLGSGAPDEILPIPFPEPDMAAASPDPETSLDVLAAREHARAGSIEAREAARRRKVDAKLGASYSTAAGEDESGDAVYAGIGVSAGIVAAFEDFDISLGAEYNTGAPSLGFSIAWKPAPRRDRELRDRDEKLAAVLEAARIDEALRSARKSTAKLESERRRLVAQAEDAAWELDFARDQVKAYAAWRDKGLVSDEEYEEVLAAERECSSRSKAAALDRALWALELKAFGAPVE